jgi:hypothetical protein
MFSFFWQTKGCEKIFKDFLLKRLGIGVIVGKFLMKFLMDF